MTTDIKVIAANLKHAYINREKVKIGGGVFSGEELKDAAEALLLYEEQKSLLQSLLQRDLDRVDDQPGHSA